MNSKIGSTLLAAAGVAVGVVGITMGGASSATPAECRVPASSASGSATSAESKAAGATPAASSPTKPTTPAGSKGKGSKGNGSSGSGSGGTSLPDNPIVDANVNPGPTPGGLPGLPGVPPAVPGVPGLPGLPGPGSGGGSGPLITVSGDAQGNNPQDGSSLIDAGGDGQVNRP